MIDAQTTAQVSNEKDTETDKKLYTNEASRKAAKDSRLKAHIEYKSILTDILKKKEESATEDITLSFLKRQFQAAVAIAGMEAR